MITDIDKLAQQMREAAGKATPGPWHRNIRPASRYPTIWAGRNTHIAYVSVGGLDGSKFPEVELEANLDHIALANPTAVLALLDDRERLVAKLALHSGDGMSLQKEIDDLRAESAQMAEVFAAKEQECERLREALKNAAGFIDTPVMRRRHGGEQFYSAVVDSVRAALATSGGGDAK